MSDAKDIAQEKINSLRVKVGEHYKHFKGGEYEIVALAIQEDTLEPLVIYRSLMKGTTWSRTAKNFLEEVHRDGKTSKRFQLIN